MLDVAFLLGSPDISGGTNVIFEHACGLGARGHRVTIVTERPVDRSLLGWHERGQRLDFLDHEACADRVFDVAVATWWRTVFDLPCVAARRHAYFVQSIETRFAEATDHESRALIDFTYRLPLPIVTEASWIQAYVRDHYGRASTLVRNGIHKSLFSPHGPAVDTDRPRGLRALVEGPIEVPFKRVPLAVTLCRQAGIEDVWLLTPWRGERYPGVTRILSRVPISDVAAVYRSCDVLVKLSTVEGMFGPPLEMMHCGGTCVTSDVTGFDEFVRDGDNALVVPLGEEHRAVEALRRLARDPALLARLKRGALETAARWPGWDVAVAGMEAFLGDVVAAADDVPTLRRELLGVVRAALDLSAPLRVARQDDRTAWQLDYPGWTLLRIARRLLHGIAWRAAMPFRARAAVPPPMEPLAPPALPVPRRGPASRASGRPRVCFVGDPARHLAHAPVGDAPFDATFVDVRGGVDAAAAAAIREFGADWTVVFTPERLSPGVRATIPGAVIGVVTTRLSQDDEAALRRTFPLVGGAPVPATVLVHPDPAAQAHLLASGVNAVAAFLPPIDAAVFAADDDEPAWSARRIPVLVLADTPRTMHRARRRLRRRDDVLAVLAPPAETMLAPLLRDARLTVHLVADGGGPLLAGKLVRDLVAGCLPVAPPLTVDLGLMAGEHYLMYEREEEVERVVALARLTPERFVVVRRVGRERAQALAPARRWLDLFGQLVEPAHAAASGGAA